MEIENMHAYFIFIIRHNSILDMLYASVIQMNDQSIMGIYLIFKHTIPNVHCTHTHGFRENETS